MKKGDIVLVQFPFTNLIGTKLRPALVIAPENKKGDIILAFITAQISKKDEHDLFISSKDPQNGLKKDSIIKLQKITTIHKRIVLGKIGELPSQRLQEVDERLIKIFQISIK